MYDTVAEKVFPFIKSLNGENSTYAAHMKDARFTGIHFEGLDGVFPSALVEEIVIVTIIGLINANAEVYEAA